MGTANYLVLAILLNLAINIITQSGLFETASLWIDLSNMIFSIGLFILSIFLFKQPIDNFNKYFEVFEENQQYQKRTLHWWEYLLIIRGVMTILVSLLFPVLLLLSLINF